MMDHIIYNVPATLASEYRTRRKIVRLRDGSDIESLLALPDLADVICLQLPVNMKGVELLRSRKCPVLPLDVIVTDPAEEFPLLHEFSQFTSVRATISIWPGLNQAVRAAASLNFYVRLEHGRADHDATDELLEVLDFYLHNPTVAQPIDYFHSVLMSMIHDNSVSLWDIQEENPGRFRTVTDDGQERLPGRLARMDLPLEMDSLVEQLSRKLFSGNKLCGGCNFFPICRGFFKRLDKAQECAGHQAVFRALQTAASELKAELAASSSQ